MKVFFFLKKSSRYQQIIKEAERPAAAARKRKPVTIELENAHSKAIPSIAGIECLLKRLERASRLLHTLAVKNKHKRIRQLAVATG